MHACEVFVEAMTRESYIRAMTDDFSLVDVVSGMSSSDSIDE